MIKRFALFTGAAVLCTVLAAMPMAAQQAAGGKMSIDEILAANLKAGGGAAAVKKITTRIAKGTVEMAGMGIRGDLEIYSEAPNKILVLFNLPGFGQLADGFDGTVAWTKNPAQGLREKTGAEFDRVKLTSEFYRPLELKQLYPSMELLPEESVEGRPAYVIKATPKDGTPEIWYIDQENFHIVKVHTDVQGPQGSVPMDSFMEDYRQQDGLVLPFRLRQSAGPMNITMTITSIENNAPIDASVFAKPAN